MSDKAIQYILDNVIEPALACDELDQRSLGNVKY